MLSNPPTPVRIEDRQVVASALTDLGIILEDLRVSRVLMVVDRGAAAATGADTALREILGVRLVGEFSEFTPNPVCQQPHAAAIAAVGTGADVMLALGGGSCMDVAKVGALAAGDIDHASGLVRGAPNAHVRPLPVIAVPTTSGTGSETTHFSAIYVDGKKISVAHPAMRPAAVILDTDLHVAMPAHIAAATGLDALCQATESIWSVSSVPQSIPHAMLAQSMILEHLVASVLEGTRDDREQVMLGAHKAGRAINITKTTAAHALSYELTTRFNIPHGHAVALTLGHVAAFNAGVSQNDCSHPLGDAHARQGVLQACRAFGVEPGAMPARMRGLLNDLKLPSTLKAAGVTRESLRPMAEAADTVRLGNNPRRLSVHDAQAILEAAWADDDRTSF